MTIGRIVKVSPSSFTKSTEAERVLALLRQYGGSRGILLGGTMLNRSVNGTRQNSYTTIHNNTGKKPAIFKWMYVDPTQAFWANNNSTAIATEDYEAGIAACKEHHENGGIVVLSPMLPNLVDGGDWAHRMRDSTACVTDLKVGSANTAAFNAWRAFLDKLADTLNNRLVDSKGNKIPVIFYWFPENNGFYNFLPNEGLIPTTQVAGRTITAMSKTSGGPGNFTFAVRSSTDVPNIPGVGQQFVVYGSPNTAWNGGWYVNSIVTGVSGDPAGGASMSITAWRNGTQPPSGTVDVSAGNTKCYPQAGAWPAGRDRVADLMIVLRESITYLKTTKNCTSLLNGISPFPAQYWSTTETNVDSSGRTMAYDNWHPGETYLDVGGINVYRPDKTDSISSGLLTSTMGRHKELYRNKPVILNELGFCFEEQTSTSLNMRGVSGYWEKEWSALQQTSPYIVGACIWSDKFLPLPTDPAFPSFLSIINSGAAVTLDKL